MKLLMDLFNLFYSTDEQLMLTVYSVENIFAVKTATKILSIKASIKPKSYVVSSTTLYRIIYVDAS